MQFLNNVARRLRSAAIRRWNRIATDLPFRMAVGRFGIRLAQLGRTLQVRYANWNSEFRLKHEIIELAYKECRVHVSEPVTRVSYLTFAASSEQPRQMTPMVRELFLIRGISQIHLTPYCVILRKGEVFSWEELLPDVEAVLLKHLVASSVA